MSISEEIRAELTDAMKAKDKPRLAALRAIQTEAATAKTEAGFDGEDGDEFYLGIISAFVKRAAKSKKEFEAAGERGAAHAAALGYEVEYLSRWLPDTADAEAEIRGHVDAAIAEFGKDPKMMGRIIGHVMQCGEGFDGALVSTIVRERLTS
ncbi:hypothetical protein MNBD_ACTINO02-2536 [hydrothermal vent metagenome]|uniref:Transamidase GatB domain protein n=1 Tax=hydrothermal vent metagenome TaxID=652676 RepID=A0A3B0SJ67_9ZZZZ